MQVAAKILPKNEVLAKNPIFLTVPNGDISKI